MNHPSARTQRSTHQKFPHGSCPSTRRTPSISSLSSLSSNSSAFSYFIGDESPLSPATPLGLSGVPFSWEKQPGIPKKQNSIKNKDPPGILLPLPPHKGASGGCKKFNNAEKGCRKKNTPQKDPFLAALLECSKDDHQHNSTNMWTGPKVTRVVSDRLVFVNLYSSCKRTCAVAESIISVPKSRRASYDLIHRSYP